MLDNPDCDSKNSICYAFHNHGLVTLVIEEVDLHHEHLIVTREASLPSY